MPRILIIALDGATFGNLDPWMEAGELPNLSRFRAEAARGALQSTMPPITGAAWTTFQTGVNPGEHGLYDWLRRDPQSYRLVPISTQLLKQPTLWDLFSQHGMQVGVLGVPVTYPPRPVNGFVVSGLLAPPGSAYTYPPALQRELESVVPGYTTMPEHWRGRHQTRAWLDGLRASLDRKLAAAQHLMQRPWDVFMVHLMETDSVQHQMWHVLDGQPRPNYHAGEVVGDPILEIFRRVDAALPALLEGAGDDAAVYILSDHGFGPLHWNVQINNWLLEHGYLKLKRRIGTLLKRTAFFGLGLTPERLYPWAERSGHVGRGSQMRHAQIYALMGKLFLSHQHIDWTRTQAYSYGNVGQISLNLAGREPQGIVPPAAAAGLVRELQAGLLELTNPHTGERVFDHVHHKRDVYRGAALDASPELMTEPKAGYMAVGTSEFVSKHVVSRARWGSGWHQMDGILMARGAGLQATQLTGARLLDMAPTLLYHAGVPIPAHLEGVVLETLFDPDFRARTPLLSGTPSNGHPAADGPANGLPQNYEEEIRKRLQSLGYI